MNLFTPYLPPVIILFTIALVWSLYRACIELVKITYNCGGSGMQILGMLQQKEQKEQVCPVPSPEMRIAECN
jgi:hypothetical protein